MNARLIVGCILSSALSLSQASRAVAQIIPDATLPTRSSVPENCTNCRIDGGTVRDRNLFHSFTEFSIPSGGQAAFNNSTTIQNIFARVTGRNPSRIDGTIAANGSANLYLLNSNGISFGSNARLELGGSFLASTADRITFQDGTEFTTNLSQSPLLTSSIPAGLGFLNPGPIQVQGNGHAQFTVATGGDVSGSTADIVLTGQGQSPTGLRVSPNKTLAMIGGNVQFEGGVLTAPAGQVEVASVTNGTVGLVPNASGFSLNYPTGTRYGPISFTRQSLLDATGDQFSQIRVRGQSIFATDASLFTIANTGTGSVGNIQLEATEAIRLIGLTPTNQQERLPFNQKISRSIIGSTTVGTGPSIILSAPDLNLSDSAFISSLTFGSGKSGNIRVQTGKTTVGGVSANESFGISSNITSLSYGSGQGGTLNITTDQLRVSDGGAISTIAYGLGAAGDLAISARDTIEITGGVPGLVIVPTPPARGVLTFYGSSITSTSTSGARSGDITIQAKKLNLLNGGQLGTVASGFGQAGTVQVNATDSVNLRGAVRLNPADFAEKFKISQAIALNFFGLRLTQLEADRETVSTIGSGAGAGNVFVRYLLGSPTMTQSEAGSVFINTPQLNVSDGLITVQNTGLGNAGVVNLAANRIRIENGTVNASTTAGDGGNVQIRSNALILRRGAITTSALGQAGNGGNIKIASDVVAAINSPNQITANSANEFGGRISIRASGIFFAPQTVVTASSARGPQFSGTVQINPPEVDLSRGSLPAPPPPSAPQIANVCQATASSKESQFIISGTGGIPQSPADQLDSNGWIDPNSKASSELTRPLPARSHRKIVEAQGWIIANGKLSLTATPNQSTVYADKRTPGCH